MTAEYVEKADNLLANPAGLPAGSCLTTGSIEHDTNTSLKVLGSQLLIMASIAALSSREPSVGQLVLIQIRSLILQLVEVVIYWVIRWVKQPGHLQPYRYIQLGVAALTQHQLLPAFSLKGHLYLRYS